MSVIGKDKLIFDPYATLSEMDNMGAYLRSGKAGALLSHRSTVKPSAGTFTFVDGDVTVGSDSIAETAHGLNTGDKVQLSTTGVLPAGLATATNYFVIRVDANNIKLAATEQDAELGIAVDITAAAGGGTHTVTGQEQDVRALDVWINNPSIAITDGGGSITVDAVNLDIRDLVYTQDSVTAYQGTDPWVIGDGGGSITVDATNLDIRDLAFATDKVDVSGSSVSISGSVAVTQSTSPWVTQDNADHAEDSAHVSGDIGSFALAVRNDVEGSLVSADGDYAPLQVDALGRLRVAADISVVTGHEKAEDAASASGDIGSYVLSVRQDSLSASTSTDGDYQSFKTDSVGALWTRISQGNVDATISSPNTAFLAQAITVGTSAVALPASALTGRRRILIQNLGQKAIFIGASGVTDLTGTRIAAGGNWELEVGPSLALYAISTAAGQDIRIFEVA